MIFRVACETYDKAWYVKADSNKDAIGFVKAMTEERGWDKEYPEEERNWECEEFSLKEGEIVESQDM